MSDNALNSSHVNEILVALQTTTSLVELDLSNNYIGRGAVTTLLFNLITKPDLSTRPRWPVQILKLRNTQMALKADLYKSFAPESTWLKAVDFHF